MSEPAVRNAYASVDYWKNEWMFVNGEIKEQK